jgi:putative membrane protein
MNNRRRIQVKKFSLSVILIAAVCFCSALTGLAQAGQDERQAPSSTASTDSAFLAKAIEANAAEVELAKLAEAKSQNPRVKAFAEMMIKDHTNALDAFHRLATGGIPAVPNQNTGAGTAQLAGGARLSKEHQELKDRLSGLSGDTFDREYMSAMVQEHRKDIRELEAEAKGTSDMSSGSSASVRQKPQPGSDTAQPMTQERILAHDLLPILKAHLQLAEDLDRQVGATAIPGNTYGAEDHGVHSKTQ